MSVLAYHPETGAQLVLDDGQLVHMRASGWLPQAEHDANQAEAAKAAEQQAASAASVKTASKEK